MKIYTHLVLLCLLLISGCREAGKKSECNLKESLEKYLDHIPGKVGIAVVSQHDTISINNEIMYPMMSVFKLHQSLAVAEYMGNQDVSLDSIISIRKAEMDSDTWSPMLNKYNNGDFHISIAELMRYAIVMSDNNASNLLFSHILSPKEVDKTVKRLVADSTFNIVWSEAEMKSDHFLSYDNHTSPLSAALLIQKVMRSDIVKHPYIDSIRTYLKEVTTGADRLGAVVNDNPKILFAHKTGSGYRNKKGELMAHNDVGYFQFPNGSSYSIAVLIKDFNGDEQEASKVIDKISTIVFDAIESPHQ